MTTYKTIAFVDTETTGLKSDSLVWSVGVVLCRLKIPSSGEWIVDERHCEEWILPRMSSEIPKNAYQRGTIIEAFRNDCDEAADIARDLMCGTYDPHEFKDRMSEHLESLRMEREAEICHFLDQADEAWAWHARFDQDVLDGMLEYETPEIRLKCAMEMFAFINPGRPKKLALAADFYRIRVNGVRLHTALYDAELLEKVWFKLKTQQMQRVHEVDRARVEEIFEEIFRRLAPPS